ncbi:MAG: hormogonium polysaccharide biosynthesis protein HpsL [Xenococcaceae cyanobacterium]
MTVLKPKSKKTKKKDEAPKLSRKEILVQKRQARLDRQKFFSLLGICIFLALLIGVPVSLYDLKIGIGIAIVLPALILSYCYPRGALWFFLIYMPFSGTVTYSVGGGNALFQLSKDIFYIPAVIALARECQRRRKPILLPKKLLPTLAIILTCCLLTLFLVNGIQQFFLPTCDSISATPFLLAPDGSFLLDPNTGLVIKTPCKDGIPLLQGVVGLKVLLGYVPLIFCMHYLIEDKKKLLFLMRLLVVLTIVCCCLGLIQYWFLASGRCTGTTGASGGDLFKTSIEARCFVGGALLYTPEQGVIRLPGTFVSPWHWAWFLIGNSFIAFTAAFNDTSRFWRTSALAALALVFINSVICGQRIALALVPAIVITLSILTGQVTNLKRFIPIGVALALILGVVAVSNPAIVQERVDSFVGRWNSAPPQEFIVNQFKFAISQQRGILGRGLGQGTNSTRAFGSVALIETFHPKILFEIGYIGLLAFMIFVTHLTMLSYKDYRSLKDKNLRSFGASFWVFVLIISYFPYWYPLDTDPVAVYYWLFAGIIFKLPYLDKQEAENKLQQPQPAGTKTKKWKLN